ncbi:MAG: response regulator [Syntrophales bacterium]|uniref:response regulator n=1 Tax=Candidatus Wunengus sp. YC61 TaxID=3367698 RepID=UPI002720218A|nr:response regulator [Syntrophales bacterium]
MEYTEYNTVENLKKIIEWLIGVESLAAEMYEKAREHFKNGDEELSALAGRLARDEHTHHEIMTKALDILNRSGVPSDTPIILGEAVKEDVESWFGEFAEMIRRGTITGPELVECIVKTEYSEWNTLFLYVVNLLKRADHGYKKAAALIARHKREIERFLKNRPEFGAQLARIKALDDIWTENILVVDDSDMVINVLKAMLEDEGRVDSAPDGRVALRKLGDRYYAAIITDVEMPVMDGVEFFKEACRTYPGIGSRFIFFTATTDPRLVQFLSENGGRAKFLPKPSSMQAIQAAVADVLSRRE